MINLSHTVYTILAGFNILAGALGLLAGFLFLIVEGLSSHPERNGLGLILLAGSMFLFVSSALYLQSWPSSRGVSGAWAVAAIAHILAVVCGAAYGIIMHALMKAGIFRGDEVVAMFTWIPAVSFLLAAMDLPIFLLSGIRRRGTRKTEDNEFPFPAHD